MRHVLAPTLLAASLALLAACEPPPVAPPPGAPAGADPAATAADQVQAEPIPGLGD